MKLQGAIKANDSENLYRPDDDLSAISRATIRAEWRKEPVLGFAGGRVHVDAKTGLSRFGPASLGTPRHPTEIRLGYVGSGQSVASARRLLERAAAGIEGDGARAPRFPGFMVDRGYFCELVEPNGAHATITANEIAAIKRLKLKRDRFDAAVRLVSDKVKLITTKDDALRLITLALPQELVGLTKNVRFNDPALGLVYRDFRRALKAELMQHRVPTQIILQRVSEAKPGDKNVDPPHRTAPGTC